MIPRIAIIDGNTLETLGLKSMIDDIIPKADVCTFSSFEDMEAEQAAFFHYFVSASILLTHSDFFLRHPHQTIVLTTRPQANSLFEHFHTLNTGQMEHELIKSLLQLHKTGHANPDGHGFHHAGFSDAQLMGQQIPISQREAEVLALVVRGFINKEIADRLCISLPTVVSHRKNICEKLHLRSVSSLTIWAVTHGIVSVDEI